MNSTDRNLDDELHKRIKHDFSKYIMITPNKGIHLRDNFILQVIWAYTGHTTYKRHKMVKYGQYISHIIVEFDDRRNAQAVSRYINNMKCGLTSVLVNDMLRCWFIYEKETWHGPPHSLTVVDIVGNPPLNLNFLRHNILYAIFQDFGGSLVLPYTAAINEPHMQVLFNSMTEALSACISFGEWYRYKEKADCFSYRVRINPSDKEENLIKNCGGTPTEAFKLCYFVKLKEVNIEERKDYVTKGKVSKTKTLINTGLPKFHEKRKYTPAENLELRQTNLFSRGTPFLYFSIFPANGYNAHASTNKLNDDFTAPVLNLKQPCSEQTPNTKSETEKSIDEQSLNSEESAQSTDNEIPEQPLNAPIVNSDSISQSRNNVPRRRGISRKGRVFERRR